MKNLDFPNVEYEFIGGFFTDFPIIRRKANWSDLGFIDDDHKHEFCGRRLKIGKEKNELFKYCPRCEIKIS